MKKVKKVSHLILTFSKVKLEVGYILQPYSDVVKYKRILSENKEDEGYGRLCNYSKQYR